MASLFQKLGQNLLTKAVGNVVGDGARVRSRLLPTFTVSIPVSLGAEASPQEAPTAPSEPGFWTRALSFEVSVGALPPVAVGTTIAPEEEGSLFWLVVLLGVGGAFATVTLAYVLLRGVLAILL